MQRKLNLPGSQNVTIPYEALHGIRGNRLFVAIYDSTYIKLSPSMAPRLTAIPTSSGVSLAMTS